MQKSSNLSKVFNILLIGKEDDPKFIAINAISNYLLFNSFQSVTSNELVSTIPVNVDFYYREKFEHINLGFGDCNDADSVSTATMKCHLLKNGDRVIRLIDPHKCDTESPYVSQIASVLKQFDSLNGIWCLFTTQNEENDKEFFLNNIKPFLCDLTKSAFRNTIFCFAYDHRPNYNIGKFKKLINTELESFDFELKTDENCFHIDYEPFQTLLARKQGYPTFTCECNENEKFWNKSQENVHLMIDKLINMDAYCLKEYFIIRKRNYFFREIKNTATTIEEEINSKLENIEEDTKRLKSYANKPRNLEKNIKLLKNIKSTPDQIEKSIKNLDMLREWTQNYIEIILGKSNLSSEDLITPSILKFLYLDPQEKQQNKQIKSDTSTTEITHNEKLQNFIATIKIRSNIKSNQIEDLWNKLPSLANFGKLFIQDFIKETLDSIKPVINLAKQIVQAYQESCEQIDHLAKCNQELRNENSSKIRLVCFQFKNNDLVYPFCFKECGCNQSEKVENCKNIEVDTKLCQTCKLHYSKHRHYSTADFIKRNENILIGMKGELKIIENVASKLDYLLLKNPQTSFDNFIEHDLHELPAKMNQTQTSESTIEVDSTIDYLNKFRDNHWKRVLQHVGGNEIIEVKNITEIQNQLFTLKYCKNKF